MVPSSLQRYGDSKEPSGNQFEEVGIGNLVPLTESDSIELRDSVPGFAFTPLWAQRRKIPVTARTLEIPLLSDL
jgi:hypothetical protein